MNVKTAKKIVAHGKRQIIPDEEEKKIFFYQNRNNKYRMNYTTVRTTLTRQL